MVWKPNVTVAAVIERDGKLLFVREIADGQVVINQPAGHLEDNETLTAAIEREVLEETAWRFQAEYLIGVYQLRLAEKQTTYLRFCFGGKLTQETANTTDDEIIETLWLTPEELAAYSEPVRSPLVTQCIEDFYIGQRYPLSMIKNFL